MARKPSPKPKHVANSRPSQAKVKAKRGPATSIANRPLDALDRMRAAFESATAPYIPDTPAPSRAHYEPAICEIVIQKAMLGHTIGATAAFIGCSRTTLHDWASSHPELADALARAKSIRQSFYEGHLIDIARRGGDSTRMSAIKLGLLNVGGEDWKERLTAEHNVTFSLASLIEQSMKLVEPSKDGPLIEHEETDKPVPLD
jgi:hypothetical protein